MGKLMRKYVVTYWWQLELAVFLVMSLLWVLPWGTSGKLYTGDDLAFHLNRIQGLYQAFQQSGNWWQVPAVATGAFSAWGYPINLFYPAVALLPAVWIQAVAQGIGGYYVFLVLLNVVTLLIAAGVANRILKSRALGFLAAVLYAFSQYRFLDFFVRGALAEGIVFAFLPLIFYGVYCLAYGDYHKWYWLAIGMALIAMTHVISLVLSAVGVVIMLSLWGLCRKDFWPRVLRLGLAAGTALLLSLSFIGPLVEQLLHVGKLGVAQYTLADSAVQVGDFLSNSLNNATASNQINVGIIFLLLVVLSFVVWTKLTALDRYCLVVGLVFTLLATDLFPWQLFQGVLGAIQFPWRFLALACFPIALVGAHALAIATRAVTLNRKLVLLPLVGLLVVGLALGTSGRFYRSAVAADNKLVTAATYQPTATGDTTTDYVAQRGQVSMAAVRTHSIPVMNTQLNGQVPTSLQQLAETPTTNGLTFSLKSTVAQTIKLPQLYYYGYHVYVNQREQQPTLDSNGVVHIKVPAGTSQIRYDYLPTTVQKLSGWLSLLAWIGLLGTLIWRWYRVNVRRLSRDKSTD